MTRSVIHILISIATLFFILALQQESYAQQVNTKYTTKYDNVDVDSILKSDRTLNYHIRCLMEEGPCTAEGRELKKVLPDALEGDCKKCNPKQKDTAERVMRHLAMKRPRDWDRLSKKYDPQGKYKTRYETFVTKTKIVQH